MTIKLPTRFFHLGERRLEKSDLRDAWEQELDECYKRRMSLHRRMKRAQRSGDHRKLAELEKQDQALSPDPEWPEVKPPAILAALIGQRSGGFVGMLREGEWDKTIPQRLRNKKGRAIWEMLSCWHQASQDEKAKLARRLEQSRDDTAWVLLRIMDYFDHRDSEFFSSLAIALEECGGSFQDVKEQLIAYRLSLNFSLTPGQPRHTIEEIQEIVAPSIKSQKVFANMIREFNVPHLRAKRGKGSPKYMARNGWRARSRSR
jgi:hypothetical protein